MNQALEGVFTQSDMLASKLLKTYSLSNHSGALRDFYKSFLARVGQTSAAEVQDDLPFWNYKTYRKTSADSRTSLDHRFRIAMAEFLKTYTDLPQKAPQREFDYGQKLAIFQRANGCCQSSCAPGTHLRFEEGQYHHIQRWTDGGPTTVENGQLLCVACHQRVHASKPDE